MRRTLPLTLAAALVVVVGATAALPDGPLYGGTTARPLDETRQPVPIYLRLTKDGGSLGAVFVLFGKCREGRVRQIVWEARNVRVRNGRFASTVDVDEKTDDGGKRIYLVSLSGRVAGASATGTYSASWTDRDAKGKVVDSCRTPAAPFRALRGARTFGGDTARLQPVVVQLNPAGTSATVSIFWNSSKRCRYTSGTDTFRFAAPVHLKNVPLRAGALSASGTHRFRSTAGDARTVTYSLAARIVGTRASGVFRATLTGTGVAAGCVSGPLRFTATSA